MASCASEIILWTIDRDITSVGALRPHKLAITSLDFSCDSTLLATASADKTVAVIDTETGRIVRKFRDHKEIVNTVAFLRPPNRDLVVSGDDNGALIIHDVRQRDPVQTLKSPSPIVTAAVSGATLAFAGVCGSVFVGTTGAAALNERVRVQCASTVFGVAVDPTERYVVTVEDTSRVTVFDIGAVPTSPERVIATIECGDATPDVVPFRVAFSHDGRYLASGFPDCKLRIWDVENIYKPIQKTELACQGQISGVAFHPSLPLVAFGSTDTTILVSEVTNCV